MGRKPKLIGPRAKKGQFYKKRPITLASIQKKMRKLKFEQKEKRYSQNTLINNTNSGGNACDSNVYNLMPNATTLAISQGTGQGDRIGNKIKITRAILRFNLMPVQDSVNNQSVPVIVRTMFIYDKLNPTAAPTPNANGDFFQNGNSTGDFAGDLTDLTRPINTDRYCVHHVRDYKVGWSSYAAGAGADPAQQYYMNNDFKMLVKRTVNYNKYIVHNLTYNDTNNAPINRGLWFFCYAVICSPITTPTLNYNMSRIIFNYELKYTDN